MNYVTHTIIDTNKHRPSFDSHLPMNRWTVTVANAEALRRLDFNALTFPAPSAYSCLRSRQVYTYFSNFTTGLVFGVLFLCLLIVFRIRNQLLLAFPDLSRTGYRQLAVSDILLPYYQWSFWKEPTRICAGNSGDVNFVPAPQILYLDEV